MELCTMQLYTTYKSCRNIIIKTSGLGHPIWIMLYESIQFPKKSNGRPSMLLD